MNATAILFTLLSATALVALPRRWAVLPFLAAVCYMTTAQTVEVGPLTFTVLRLLVLAGVFRVLVRRERPAGRWNTLDALLLAWGLWAIVSSLVHRNPVAFFITQAGTVYNVWGVYFLLRVFCSSLDDVVRLVRATSFVLVPVALEMVYEQYAAHNLFSVLGGVSDTPQLRDGRLRASGPFAHAILAGTVGGVMLPLMIGIWPRHRASAALGTLVCATIVITSASSGPLSTALIALLALCLWGLRTYTRAFRWMIVAAYAALIVLMERPPYYVIQRFEFVGGSTGWYRARLIETSLEHLNEWWLFGTDRTRHWLVGNPHGVDPNHIDITNHYLTLGVMGGLPLLLLYVMILTVAFSYVGRAVRASRESGSQRFVHWALGSALLAHTVTGISVSYFDQSVLFLYLTLAAIGSARGVAGLAAREPRFAVVRRRLMAPHHGSGPPSAPTAVSSPKRSRPSVFAPSPLDP